MTPDLLGGVLAFFFTVALLSYLIGDNPLYRVALHLFIGVSVGYVALVVIYQALLPRLFQPLIDGVTRGDWLIAGLAAIPLVLFILLLLRLSTRFRGIGNFAVAFMIGVGTAVAIGGAVTGTLIPQITATAKITGEGFTFVDFLNGVIIVIGTVTTLLYFQFWVRGRAATGDAERVALIRYTGYVGQGFLMLTLGVIYGGMILSGMAVLSERLMALYGWLINLLT
jgi:hypothetical protein